MVRDRCHGPPPAPCLDALMKSSSLPWVLEADAEIDEDEPAFKHGITRRDLRPLTYGFFPVCVFSSDV